MIIRLPRMLSLLLIAAVATLGLTMPSAGQSADPSASLKSELKSTLEIYDQAFLDSFNLQLKVTTPTSIKKMHGRSSSLVSYTAGNAGKFMQLENVSRDPVKYDQDGGASYDAQKNFLLAADKRISIALEGKAWRVRRDRESLTIDPTDKILATKVLAPLLEDYPAGHRDAANLFYRYLLALGRGYSQLLDEVTGVQQNADGSLTVKANGKLFSPYCGVWSLEVDPAADFLVRKATFIQAGQAKPTFESLSAGQVGGKIPLHATGTATISRYAISVEVVSYENAPTTPNEGLTTGTHERVAYDAPATDAAAQSRYQALFPKETIVMNFGSIDSDGMPLVQKHVR